MALHVLTLVLNGMPWIAAQWANLVASRADFHWHVVEGAAAPTHCTSWCKPMEPQYSKDGTREFLDSLRHSPHVTVYRKPIWDGKVTMCNTALANIKTSGILLQMDSDEIWTPAQLFQFQRLFAGNQSHAYFWCRYFFGPDIVMTTRNCYANNPKQEWKRAWRFETGMKFTTHTSRPYWTARNRTPSCTLRVNFSIPVGVDLPGDASDEFEQVWKLILEARDGRIHWGAVLKSMRSENEIHPTA